VPGLRYCIKHFRPADCSIQPIIVIGAQISPAVKPKQLSELYPFAPVQITIASLLPLQHYQGRRGQRISQYEPLLLCRFLERAV
jgi:hypothetical protein